MSTVLPAPRQEGAGADASPVPAASRVALRLLGISKRYPGVQALRDVSFECAEGEIHAVVGENGSGKSTLLGMASGVNAPDTGSVEILGQQLPWAHPAPLNLSPIS